MAEHAHVMPFLDALFWHHDGLIDVKGLAPKRAPVRVFYEDPVEAMNLVLELNPQGLNMFVGVNPRQTPGGTEDDVHRVWALFLDLDLKKGVNPRETFTLLVNNNLTPSIGVLSGNGAHFYLLLKEPADPMTAKTIWERLCKATGSDPVHNVNRIARVPGTVNWKEPPTWCVLDGLTDRRYELDEIAAGLDRMGAPNVVPQQAKVEIMQGDPLFTKERWHAVRSMLEPLVLDLLEFGIQNSAGQVSRSEADWVVVCALVREGMTDDQIEWVYQNYEIGKLKYREPGAGSRYLRQTLKMARYRAAQPIQRKKRRWAGVTQSSPRHLWKGSR